MFRETSFDGLEKKIIWMNLNEKQNQAFFGKIEISFGIRNYLRSQSQTKWKDVAPYPENDEKIIINLKCILKTAVNISKSRTSKFWIFEIFFQFFFDCEPLILTFHVLFVSLVQESKENKVVWMNLNKNKIWALFGKIQISFAIRLFQAKMALKWRKKFKSIWEILEKLRANKWISRISNFKFLKIFSTFITLWSMYWFFKIHTYVQLLKNYRKKISWLK